MRLSIHRRCECAADGMIRTAHSGHRGGARIDAAAGKSAGNNGVGEGGATWSGRGRMPAWLVGQDPRRFLIHPEEDQS